MNVQTRLEAKAILDRLVADLTSVVAAGTEDQAASSTKSNPNRLRVPIRLAQPFPY
jgi:hypothetical protein